jgi:hypothetical protein
MIQALILLTVLYVIIPVGLLFTIIVVADIPFATIHFEEDEDD